MKDVTLLQTSGIDVKKALELLGDMETYDATLEDFLGGIYGKLADLQSCKEVSDMTNYAVFAHSIKSDARYLGFTKLADIAYVHELASKANNVDEVNAKFEELMNTVDEFTSLAKKYLG